MVRHRGVLLLDTNVILEAHRTGSWRALVGGYQVETVEDCVTETQTGFQRRRPEQQIDGVELRASLGTVYPVGDLERAELKLGTPDIELHIGEASLWAHALGWNDEWVLCGPDKASLRCGIRLGFRERLVPLEGLLNDVGYRPGTALRAQYTRRWHERVLGELILMEGDGLS